MINMPLVIAFATIGWVSTLIYYKYKGYVPLPANEPSVAFFPKYSIRIELPEVPRSETDSSSVLISLVEDLGFTISEKTEGLIKLNRGSLLGDFSINLAKVNVSLLLPIKAEATINIEYGMFAAFDTGDLWLFSNELRSKIVSAT